MQIKKNLLFIFKFKNVANLEKEEEEETNSTLTIKTIIN